MQIKFVMKTMNNLHMNFFLHLLITFLFVSIHAEHKRVIIKVPERTKHVYHHHVKKVPIYVLLPDKKPKIIDDLEVVRPTVKRPCKDSDDRGDPEARHSQSYADQGKVQVVDWTEDRENQGALTHSEPYRTLENDLPPPPPIDLYNLPFRRVNTETVNYNQQVNNAPPSPVQQQVYQQNYQQDYQQSYQQPIRTRKANPNVEYRQRENIFRQQDNAVSFAYTPEGNGHGQQGSYQYNTFQG